MIFRKEWLEKEIPIGEADIKLSRKMKVSKTPTIRQGHGTCFMQKQRCFIFVQVASYKLQVARRASEKNSPALSLYNVYYKPFKMNKNPILQAAL